MVSSRAATPEDYLAELGPVRAADIAAVRDLINAAIPPGYVERMAWGMISWDVPIEVSGPTYNGQPLVYVGLAAQKNHNALYLNGVYASPKRTEQLRQAWAASGRKLDMGKSCLRFKRFENLAVDVLRDEIASLSPGDFAQMFPAPRSA